MYLIIYYTRRVNINTYNCNTRASARGTIVIIIIIPMVPCIQYVRSATIPCLQRVDNNIERVTISDYEYINNIYYARVEIVLLYQITPHMYNNNKYVLDIRRVQKSGTIPR